MPQPRNFGQLQRRLDCRDNTFGKPILEVEHVTYVAFEPIGPDMRSRGRIDELSRETKTVTAAADAPLQDVVNPEFAPDLADIDGFTFVGERRVPGDNEQPGT